MLLHIPGLVFNRKPSKDTAKERLKLILECDKKNLSPHLMETIKDEIIKVISTHLDINKDDLEFSITKSIEYNDDKKAVPVLIANIPIKTK